MSPQLFICFEKKHSARTGNILFQYLFCKFITHIVAANHLHIPIEELPSGVATEYIFENTIDHTRVTDPEYLAELRNKYQHKHIVCSGYFQDSRYYVPYREPLLKILYSPQNNDHWIGFYGRLEYISEFLSGGGCAAACDGIIVSLRLDDFIQLPASTSDILPPQYYTKILETYCETYDDACNGIYESDTPESCPPKFTIICDKIRHQWEFDYLQHFKRWNYTLSQENLANDCAVMRDAAFLVHSNSSLCWIMSFFSRTPNKRRFIPMTGFYQHQHLGKIEDGDVVLQQTPLTHTQVYELRHTAIASNSHAILTCCCREPVSLSYCIPDECIISPDDVADLNKTNLIAPLIPRNTSTYIYETEAEYYAMYRSAYFAHTEKKGGWDCLRHYEIIANGCIPLFRDIDKCPDKTMSTFPRYISYYNDMELGKLDRYALSHDFEIKHFIKMLVRYAHRICSTSARANFFLHNMLPKYNIIQPQQQNEPENLPKINVLLIRGNCGVNYTRETLWIGLHRKVTAAGGVAAEYPAMDFMYDDYPETEAKNLYGKGFTYSRRLDHTQRTAIANDADLIDKIKSRFWTLIIYGKVGPDEDIEGSLPNMPFWDYVHQYYSANEIAFLYGGDACQDMTIDNQYSRHLMRHLQFGRCFVRELR